MNRTICLLSLPVALCILTGCASSRREVPLTSDPILTAPAAQSADRSLTVADYIRIGIPEPDRTWTAAEYRRCRDVLYGLDRTNRAAMPRLGSTRSGPVFARLINPTNTLPLTERVLPGRERVRFFSDLANVYTAFLDLYDPSIEPTLHHESIELNHTYLRMLRSAVELDNLPLPPARGETNRTILRVSEISRTLVEDIRGSHISKSVVPRGDRYSVLGGFCAKSVHQVLPWLADPARLPESERVAGAVYLRQDVPVLWKHVPTAAQQDLLGVLEVVLQQTTNEKVRGELELLRIQIAPVSPSM